MMLLNQFSMAGKTVLLTGSEGLFGKIHKEVIKELGGKCIGIDIKGKPDYNLDVGRLYDVSNLASEIGSVIDVVINNAVGNQYAVVDPIANWDRDIRTGLSGAMHVGIEFGEQMFKHKGKGVILNMGSDMGIIAPDHSLYDGKFKPISYSAVKHGIIGLSKYFATLWDGNIRSNCLCPGGIDVGQKVARSPMKRLAKTGEMKGAIAYLISDASSFMTGQTLIVDGGRCAI